MSAKTKFFHFDQNNSGGYFVRDDQYGICESVIIEAETAKKAFSQLEEIGENVPGMFTFCDCCGERWSDWLDDSEGTDDPMIYNTPIEKVEASTFRSKCFIHYVDGTFKEVVFKPKTPTPQ